MPARVSSQRTPPRGSRAAADPRSARTGPSRAPGTRRDSAGWPRQRRDSRDPWHVVHRRRMARRRSQHAHLPAIRAGPPGEPAAARDQLHSQAPRRDAAGEKCPAARCRVRRTIGISSGGLRRSSTAPVASPASVPSVRAPGTGAAPPRPARTHPPRRDRRFSDRAGRVGATAAGLDVTFVDLENLASARCLLAGTTHHALDADGRSGPAPLRLQRLWTACDDGFSLPGIALRNKFVTCATRRGRILRRMVASISMATTSVARPARMSSR